MQASATSGGDGRGTDDLGHDEERMIETERRWPATLWVAILLLGLAGAASADDGVYLPDREGYESGPDYAGLRRDTYYFLGDQFAIIGALYVMPEGVSGWDEESKDDWSVDTWKENVSNIAWDKDDYFINYVLHPYWGASYYVRGRERGLSRNGSFWYSALLSSLYEFGIEAFFEEPSIQDLIVTPVGGALLGEYFMNVREDIYDRVDRRGTLSGKDKMLLALTDPLGTLNRKTDQIFKRETHLTLNTFVRTRPWSDANPVGSPFDVNSNAPPPRIDDSKSMFGVRVQLRF
jgi:hypothetical protein